MSNLTYQEDYKQLCTLFKSKTGILTNTIYYKYNIVINIVDFVHWAGNNNLLNKTPDELIVLWKLENGS